MKIGLIDVDGHNFPNLVLMKLSAYHKQLSDNVEWYMPFNHYDLVYLSKVFTFTPDYLYHINAERIVKGGTGYDVKSKPLPYNVEHIYPDYNLYNITNKAIGFLSRGCPRNCSFCIVGSKEGTTSKKVANLSEFLRGQKNIVLLDPNILACRQWDELLEQLEYSNAVIDFSQGLDARLLNLNKIKALERLKIKRIHFAWDNYNDRSVILPKLELFASSSIMPHKHNAMCYVLVNYNTTIEQDLDRIYTLRELGFWAYVMVYDRNKAPSITLAMQRWCNNRIIYAKCPNFKQYMHLETKQDKSQLDLFLSI